MTRLKSYLYLVAPAALLVVSHAVAAGTTMTTDWKYNQPVTVTGDNLDGDDPYYNKLCIAPAGMKENKKCYDPDDSDDGLTIDKWDNGTLSFYAPPNIPVNGVVILQVRAATQHCFGSAGCNDWTEDTEKEIGTYKAAPFVTDLVDMASGKNVFEIKENGTYKVKGAFFGEGKGSIFIQVVRGSNQLDPSNILSWTYDTITFKVPSGIEPLGFSVNNGATATKYDLTSATSSSSSAKNVSSSSKSSSSVSSKAAQVNVQLFTDVGSGNPYKDAIGWAKQSGILQGYPDGTFQPDRTVNRAEFLKIVLGAKGINVSDATGDAGFKDVDNNAWYAPYIRYAKTQGFIQGYPDGTFKPDQTVNFAEALKMAYSALGVTTSDIGGNWYDRYLQHAKTNNVLYTTNVQVDGGMSRKDVVWIAWKLMTHTGDWEQPSKITNTTPPPTNSAAAHFSDGTYVVGKDIQAGTYRTRKAASGCYYSRLNGFSGELEDILANENTDSPAIVTIAPTDKGFTSKRCGTWTEDLSAITTSKTSFGDGMFVVGTDIEAGTYKSSGGSSCYYSRLGGFTGELEDIVSNENTDTSAIVTISDSDKGFLSKRCGTWTKM